MLALVEYNEPCPLALRRSFSWTEAPYISYIKHAPSVRVLLSRLRALHAQDCECFVDKHCGPDERLQDTEATHPKCGCGLDVVDERTEEGNAVEAAGLMHTMHFPLTSTTLSYVLLSTTHSAVILFVHVISIDSFSTICLSGTHSIDYPASNSLITLLVSSGPATEIVLMPVFITT